MISIALVWASIKIFCSNILKHMYFSKVKDISSCDTNMSALIELVNNALLNSYLYHCLSQWEKLVKTANFLLFSFRLSWKPFVPYEVIQRQISRIRIVLVWAIFLLVSGWDKDMNEVWWTLPSKDLQRKLSTKGLYRPYCYPEFDISIPNKQTAAPLYLKDVKKFFARSILTANKSVPYHTFANLYCI